MPIIVGDISAVVNTRWVTFTPASFNMTTWDRTDAPSAIAAAAWATSGATSGSGSRVFGAGLR